MSDYDSDSYVTDSDNDNNNGGSKEIYVPISKCSLVGAIVSAEIRSDGSRLYVLDDGTGLMDCVDWSCSYTTIHGNRLQNNIFQIPSLFSLNVSKINQQHQHQEKHFYGHNPKTKIWSILFKPLNQNSVIPVNYIKCRFLYHKETVKFKTYTDDVTICIDLPFNSFL